MKKLLLTLCLTLMLPLFAGAETKTYQFETGGKNGITDNQGGSWTNGTPAFSFSSNQVPGQFGGSGASSRGISTGQTGSITSDAQFANVTKITVDVSSNAAGNTIKVYIGGTQIGSSSIASSNHQKMVFESTTPLSGAITFSVTRSSKTIWIAGFEITTEGSQIDPDPVEKVATPVITTTTGDMNLYPGDAVEITCETEGAEIFYDINSSEPVKYTGPITFSEDGVYEIGAYATKEGATQSELATYVVKYSSVKPTPAETVTSTLTVNSFGVTGTSYTDASAEDNGITYKAQMAGSYSSIQLRSSNNNSGIVVTANKEGYVLRKVEVEWNSNTASGRVLDIYGAEQAYTSPSDLYNSNKQGKKLGSIEYSNQPVVLEIKDGDYQYVGFRSNSSAMYISSLKLTWEKLQVEGKTESQLSFDKSEYTVFEGQEKFEGLPVLSNPLGIDVVYKSSDESVAIYDNYGLLIDKVGTATITVTPADTEKYYGTASFKINVVKNYDSLQKLNALVDKETAYVNFPMTVVAVQSAYTYVVDGKGGNGLIYKYDLGYEAGDVIPAGWTAKMSIYNALHELVPEGNMPAATEKGEFEIPTVEVELLEVVSENEVVKVDFVTFEDATPASKDFYGYFGETEIYFYNSAKIASVPAGVYNVTLAASVYNETIQYIPLEYVAVHPSLVIDGQEVTDLETTIDLTGKEKVVIELAPVDSEKHTVFHKFEAESAPAAVKALAEDNDGYTAYSEPIEITKAGTLTFYAQHNTNFAKSAARTITFKGETTAISEISVAEGNAEWFDIQGRRVTNPAKGGIYIRKQGSSVSKVAL